MARVFDRIQIVVPALGPAVEQYQLLFDTHAWVGELPAGRMVARWGLPNTVIEVVEGLKPGLHGIVFAVPGASPGDESLVNTMGLALKHCDGQDTERFRGQHPQAQCQALRVDHVVLRSDNAPECIALFRDELGIRLALDKTVPEWGGRMLFFRGGKLTLEVIESGADDSQGNYFWGLAYQCNELEALVARLRAQGAEVSDTKEGRKPGTRVASLKSHCLEIPTLLIQQVQT